MKAWKREIQSWNISFILKAVDDKYWQAFRLSMKGVSTEEKLDMLEDYVRCCIAADSYTAIEQCRVDNYLNALKRGGQLTVEGKVQR